ncbi:MAG: hypothetical protein R2704_03710 [Microthrixaceae bacterium]
MRLAVEEWLGFEKQTAQDLAGSEVAFGLDDLHQLLVVEVAVAEVPSEGQAGDELALQRVKRIGAPLGVCPSSAAARSR